MLPVFDKLAKMSLGNSRDELLECAKFGKGGALKRIEFDWLKKGNKLHKTWKNTVMGKVLIDGKKLAIEVNSEKRAEGAQAKIEKLLGPKAIFKRKTVEPMKKKNNNSSLEIPLIKSKDEDLNSLPEVQAFIQKMVASHWENWINTKIPALKNLTPKEAAKTELGRERLEALFADFEIHNREKINPTLMAPVLELRKQLGINNKSPDASTIIA